MLQILQLLHTPLLVLHIFSCMFLMLVVLLQPGQSGGLGALTGAGATQVFGGRGASTFLSKVTWVTATIFFMTSVTLAYSSSSNDTSLQQRAKSEAHRDVVPIKNNKPVPAKK